MNLFTRIIRSLQEAALFDRGFENYYGALVRTEQAGGPTASEARRDFMAARRPMDRVGIL